MVILPPDDEARPDASSPGSESEVLMRALHRATLSLYSDLSLEGVLRRITQAAKDLVHARYAALGVQDAVGGLQGFIALGMTAEEMRRIDHQPVGKGLLGEMLRAGRSIRLSDLRRHPAAEGFPPGHPAMTSFLGVPIAAYGKPLGQLYLTDKQGAPEFTAQDQRLIEMLAAHAAAAIENAHLYKRIVSSEEELKQRNEELQLFNSLATAVSSLMDVEPLLENMLESVMGLFAAESGEVFVQEEDDGIYHHMVRRGRSESLWSTDHFHPGEGFVGGVAADRKVSWTTEARTDPWFLSPDSFKTLVGVPLTVRGHVLGVMTLAFHSERPITPREAGLLEAMGAGVGVNIDNLRLFRQARRLAVLEERERIGMDLHDGIIQSIYAVGLTLDYTRLLLRDSSEKAGTRLEQAIDGLNSIIRDIRSYILDLQPSRISTDNLVEALTRLVREFKANTLVETDLQIEAGAVHDLGRQERTALFLITQEALANTAKHAGASRVQVSVRSVGKTVLLQIIDNGRGFAAGPAAGPLGHGLSNMQERARAVGGSLKVVSSPGAGTTVTVRLTGRRGSPPAESA
jgi:two-component system, NarL family, sensor histidine kinase DevS